MMSFIHTDRCKPGRVRAWVCQNVPGRIRACIQLFFTTTQYSCRQLLLKQSSRLP